MNQYKYSVRRDPTEASRLGNDGTTYRPKNSDLTRDCPLSICTALIAAEGYYEKAKNALDYSCKREMPAPEVQSSLVPTYVYENCMRMVKQEPTMRVDEAARGYNGYYGPIYHRKQRKSKKSRRH